MNKRNIFRIIVLLLFVTTQLYSIPQGQSFDVLIKKDWEEQKVNKTITESIVNELSRIDRIINRQKNRLTSSKLDIVENKFAEFKVRFNTTSGLDFNDLYVKIREFKRDLMLNDPNIDFTDILLIDNPYTKGPEPTHEVRTRTENTAVYGGKMGVLKDFRTKHLMTALAPSVDSEASFWRPDLSYDAQKILFCMRESKGNSYNIYEIGVDGENLKQITNSDYNDLDPIYAPNGDIIFSTSRSNQYLRCGGAGYRMFTLARSDNNGKNIYFISSNIDADFTPVFLQDGRLLYTRWEYIDKSVFRLQSLWTVNPDGTNPQAYWGNQSRWPDMLMNARPIPNTQLVVFNASGHHDIFGGPIGIVNYNEGTNYPDGLYNVTNNIPWAEVGNGPADKFWNEKFTSPTCYMAFQTPYPISEDLMLVSARKGSRFETVHDPNLQNFDLYLMDLDGNMELIYKGENNIFYAQPVRKRKKPAMLPSSVVWPGKMLSADHEPEWGTLYSGSVYDNSGISRGMVKYLRILEVEPQTYSDGCRTQDDEKMPFLSDGAMPVYHGYGETVVSLLMDDATKRIWGTVPVEEDGSVNFHVPPVKGLYFQLLDKDGLALQTMRSSTHVMPGEVRGCYGCHETKVQTPSVIRSQALKRKPSTITPPSWGDSTINFTSFVQPILDRNCISCHNAKTPNANFDFTARKAPNTSITWSYVKLVFGDNPKNTDEWAQKSIAGPIIPYHVYTNNNVKYPTEETVVPPMVALSYRSKLIYIASSGDHHDVKVTDEEKEKLIAWVDALCPFFGLEDIVSQPDMPAEEYVKQSDYNTDLSFPPLMRTAPYIHKAFMQDDFNTQEDRIPKDRDGKKQPSMIMKDKKRLYQIPFPKN